MQQLMNWLVAFMLAKAPLTRPHYIPEAKETVEEGQVRYESIAADIAEVLKDEKPLFKGPDGKLRTSALILSVMFHESGFRRDVDLGLGKLSKGDNGNSVCLMQLNIGKGKTMKWNKVLNRPAYPADPKEDLEEGWTAKEVLADRKKCIRAGLRLLRLSFGSCGPNPKDWLRIYASGNCKSGAKESASRVGLAQRWYAANKPSFDDTVFLPPPPPKQDGFPPIESTSGADEVSGYQRETFDVVVDRLIKTTSVAGTPQ